MKFLKKTISLCILLVSHGYGINISKLQLKEIHIINRTNKKQEARFFVYSKCLACSDSNSKIKSFFLNPKEQKNIQLSGTIMNITLKSKSNIHLMKDNFLYVVISDEKSKSSFIPVEMEKTLTEEINFHEFIEFIDKVPLSSQKSLRGLCLLGIKAKDFYKEMCNLYRNNYVTINGLFSKKSIYKIPTTIHNVWLGRELPLYYKKKMKDWRKKHPVWRKICWTEQLIKKHYTNNFLNQKTFDSAILRKNYAKASDVARYEIIYKFGGLYVDVDFECFECFDDLHKSYDFYASLEHPLIASGGCLNGVFGSKSGHPILELCMNDIKSHEDNPPAFDYCKTNIDLELERTWILTGPGVFTKSIFFGKNREKNFDIIFPYQCFSPIDMNMERKIKLESFCYHSYKCRYDHEKHWTNTIAYQLQNSTF
jgi:mannosyltransferase OCH1-like enzyme